MISIIFLCDLQAVNEKKLFFLKKNHIPLFKTQGLLQIPRETGKSTK